MFSEKLIGLSEANSDPKATFRKRRRLAMGCTEVARSRGPRAKIPVFVTPGLAPMRLITDNPIMICSPVHVWRRALLLGVRLARYSLWCLPISGFGALKWDNIQANVSAWAGDKSAAAVYHFRNEGTSPITIVSARPSCGCTTVELPTKTVAAGATGEIDAVFEIGDMVGQQTKLITVITDDAPAKATTLVLNVNIQQFATVNPEFVYWRVGDAVAAKRIEITATASKMIAAIEATPSNPGILTRIEPIEPGRKYVLWLTPASTAKALSTTVVCRAQIDGQSRRLVNVVALVAR